MKNFLKLALSLVLIFAISSCDTQNKDNNKKTGENTKNSQETSSQNKEKSDPIVVKIGLMGSDTRVWDDVAKRVLESDNIKLELVSFSQYPIINDALVEKTLDLNAYQHQIYLDSYNSSKGTDLVGIGNTINAPLGIYSQKIKNVSEIKEGDTIAIPNDETNRGRALILLQSAGLIELKEDAGLKATQSEISKNPLNLIIEELDASQNARVLPDIAASIINSQIAVDGGFAPSKDAIYLEKVDESSKPYINIIVARKEDENNELYKKVVKAYQSEETKKIIEETTKGSQVPAW